MGNITSTEQKTKLTKAPKHDKNPFLEAIVVKTKSKRLTVARGGMIVDHQTGAIEGVTEIAQLVEVDEGQFIKLFTKDLAVWFDLTKTGMRVFGALLATVQEQAIMRDSVFFDYNHPTVEAFKITKSTFYRGLEELMEKKFIARGRTTGWYFTNPEIFFNGNRARFVKEYRVKQQHELPLEEPTTQSLLPDQNA